MPRTTACYRLDVVVYAAVVVLASSTSGGDDRWSVNGGNRKAEGKRSEVRRRTRSERDIARRVSFNSRPQQPVESSFERRHRDCRQEGTWGRRTASGSPRGRRRCCENPTRASSTRSVNADHLSTAQPGTSSEHLRRVALAVRQLTDLGEYMLYYYH